MPWNIQATIDADSGRMENVRSALQSLYNTLQQQGVRVQSFVVTDENGRAMMDTPSTAGAPGDATGANAPSGSVPQGTVPGPAPGTGPTDTQTSAAAQAQNAANATSPTQPQSATPNPPVPVPGPARGGTASATTTTQPGVDAARARAEASAATRAGNARTTGSSGGTTATRGR